MSEADCCVCAVDAERGECFEDDGAGCAGGGGEADVDCVMEVRCSLCGRCAGARCRCGWGCVARHE